MVFISRHLAALITAALLSQAVAHPGHDVGDEIQARSAFYKNNKRDLSHCTDNLKKRGIQEKQAKRRQNEVNKMRKERGITQSKDRKIKARDTVLDESHLSTLDVTSTTESSGYWGVEDIIFSNASCVLMPSGEVGPFWVDGEYIRRDVRETQAGIDMVIDAQFIDVTTCEPVAGVMWDIWNANSTGVYGGVIGSGNGNSADTSNLNNTALRGLQMTDGDGVAQFLTIFPGHYAGRATHIHVIAHVGGTVLTNGTYSGGTFPYIGQLFFDQDLITQINANEPYSSNTISITANADDRVVASEIVDNADPFMNYVLIGDSVTDGMFMWIDIGIDPTASYQAHAASDWTAGGGVET